MKRIAITGGIGAGKSYVCALLKQRGIDIYDCDKGAKRLMAESEVLKQRLMELVGPKTYVNGVLNKAAMASFLLASEENKQAINAIVHPAVIEDFYASGMQWMECAILYEAHLEQTVDAVVCVTAPEKVRVRRIMKRDGISEDKAYEWLRCQMSQEEIVHRADIEIENDGVTPLEPQIEDALARLEAIVKKRSN